MQNCNFPAKLNAGSSTRLPIEKTAFGGFEHQMVWIVTLCGDVGVKSLVAELRTQHAFLADEIMMLRVDLITALMKIRRRRLRRKGAKAEVVQLLRIQLQSKPRLSASD